ncbi:MAG: aldo/keto reductase [Gemmatimonadaceae bacterium]|nr:aldo/keto reductase [Gemmatimonadaceae bacterium]
MMNTGRTTATDQSGQRPVADARRENAPRTDHGRATLEGTARFAARFAPTRIADFYRNAAGDLLVSSLGIGTYLGESDDAEDARYARALRAAIESGVNLIDTAINYRCQRSERVVGRTMASLQAAGTVRRDELVVCTKGGYVPLDGCVPPTREEYNALLEREYFDRGVMRREDVVGGGHCLAPSFLADQIARSRANLGVATIDYYYVHNPEQELPVLGREAFRRRMIRAFEALEARVEAGDIGAYGCATWNGFRVPPESRDHLSLEELVGVAREIAGDAHHFRLVQLPVNLAMSEALRAQTQLVAGRPRTLVEAATDLAITVVASASLMQASLARSLPSAVRDALPRFDTDAQRALAFVRGAPGVTSALVGMREPAHVRENVAIAAVEPREA